MLCFGLLVGLGESDLGDSELGEWRGEEASGGEGMERGLGGALGLTVRDRLIVSEIRVGGREKYKS